MSVQRVWFSESYVFLGVTFSSPQDIVIGASSGFCLTLITYGSEQGDIVIATIGKPETLKYLLGKGAEGRFLILKVDVSSPDDIKMLSGPQNKQATGREAVVCHRRG